MTKFFLGFICYRLGFFLKLFKFNLEVLNIFSQIFYLLVTYLIVSDQYYKIINKNGNLFIQKYHTCHCFDRFKSIRVGKVQNSGHAIINIYWKNQLSL